MTFSSDIETALAEYMAEHSFTREQAIETILRDWLNGNVYIPAVLDEDDPDDHN